MSEDDAERNALYRRLLLLKLEQLAQGKDNTEAIGKVSRKIITSKDAVVYAVFERDSELSFEQGCLAITEQLHKDAKLMTVMEYHSALKLLDERAKELKKITSRHKR